MAKRNDPAVDAAFEQAGAEVHNITLTDELESSYLEYSYSVIHSRALPDARDGLKPVHRRILFGMSEAGLRPDHAYVKCARVVGDCFPAGALVSGTHGLVPIEALNVGDFVLTHDGNRVKVSAVYANPPAPMLRLTLSDGRQVMTTPGQQLRTIEDDYSLGWVTASESAGARLVSPRQFLDMPDAQPEPGLLDRAYVAGLMVAEGYPVNRNASNDNRVGMAMVEVGPIAAAAGSLRGEGYRVADRVIAPQESHHSPKTEIRVSGHADLYSLVEPKSDGRFVPDFVLEDRTLYFSFIAGFFDGDGNVIDLDKKRRRALRFVSASRRLLQQIGLMLREYGIHSTIADAHGPNWVPAKEHHLPSFVLTVFGEEAVRLSNFLKPHTRSPHKAESLDALIELPCKAQPSTADKFPSRVINAELRNHQRGGGWYVDAETGSRFRMRTTSGFGSGKRDGHASRRQRPITRAALSSGGVLDILARVGSPVSGRVRHAVDSVSPVYVMSIERIEDCRNFDIQVESHDHEFVVEGLAVHNCMGRYHPHGDSAIYDSMVRMVQDFSLNTPLIDGHGNFGSPDYSAAAMRYTEARLAAMAMNLVGEIKEDTVDFMPTYDGSGSEPVVLPAAFPNLLVNGSTGIAVGMSTNMIPHNLNEVIEAARYLIKSPNATLDKLMTFIPGPDLPTGGLILGADQIRQAYETGKGVVRIRARATTGPLEGGRGKSAITVTELPYGVGTEKVIEAIKKELGNKRLQGISDVKDLSDRVHGLQLVIETKAGVNADVVLAELYKYTPLESSFGIQNLALVDGQPKQMGLHELLTVFLNHRYDVVTRRTQFRLKKAQDRLHIVEGLLIALDNIDEVVKIIRGSKDTAEAREKLIKKFKLSDIQAGVILDMPLRRLVALEVLSLRDEKKSLLETISELENILNNEDVLKKVVSDELAAVAKANPSPRRSTLVGGDLKEILEASKPAAPLEVADEPTQVLMSTAGILGRTAVETENAEKGRRRNARSKHDAITHIVDSTTRSNLLLITSLGRAVRLSTLTVPALTIAPGVLSIRGGVSSKELLSLAPKETVVGIAPADDTSGVLAIGTRNGTVKLVTPEWPVRSDDFTVIGLKDGDTVVNAYWVSTDQARTAEFAFVTSEASLLRFPVEKVRAQGLSGGGVAGISMPEGVSVVSFNVVDPAQDNYVVTFTGQSAKVTPFSAYPGKGRATGGVRCHKFLKGEDHIEVAAVTDAPVAASASGEPLELPAADPRRDGSGSKHAGFAAVGFAVEQD